MGISLADFKRMANGTLAAGVRQRPEVMAVLSGEAETEGAKPSKMRNVKCEVDGHRFDSIMEAKRYTYLRLLERAGEITDLVLQPRFMLLEKAKGRRAIVYVADFMYTERGRVIVEDVKGFETATFRMKRKMFLARYPDLDFRIIRKDNLHG